MTLCLCACFLSFSFCWFHHHSFNLIIQWVHLSPTLRSPILDIHPANMFSAPEPHLIQGEYTYWVMVQNLTPFERTRRFILLSVYLGLAGVMEESTHTAYATLVVTLLTFYRVVIFDLLVVGIKHTSLPKAASYSRI